MTKKEEGILGRLISEVHNNFRTRSTLCIRDGLSHATSVETNQILLGTEHLREVYNYLFVLKEVSFNWRDII